MNEDKTLNDELEANQSVDETFTETEETTSEAEFQAESDDTDGEDTITLSRADFEAQLKQRDKERDKRWKARLKAAQGDDEGSPKNHQKVEESVASKEEMDRFRLETKGIEDKQAQDFVLKFAKLEGIPVTDALKDDIVQAKLQKFTSDAERVRATQLPTNRIGRPREKTPEELARMAEQGQIPKTKEERKAALKVLQAKYPRTDS